MYFEDLDYKKFLNEISSLVKDDNEFRKKFIDVNHILLSNSKNTFSL